VEAFIVDERRPIFLFAERPSDVLTRHRLIPLLAFFSIHRYLVLHPSFFFGFVSGFILFETEVHILSSPSRYKHKYIMGGSVLDENTSSSSSSSSSSSWQFKKLEEWSVKEVASWLASISLSDVSSSLEKEDVDGKTLQGISEEDLKGLGLTLGKRKAILRSREELLNPSSSSSSSSSSPSATSSSSSFTPKPISPLLKEAPSLDSTFTLPRGVIPTARGLTPVERRLVRLNVYDPETKKWIPRPDGPLTEEEAECWEYQASWLICPVSGNCFNLTCRER
jgi:hypothetical protein